jgi:hypothetical protein
MNRILSDDPEYMMPPPDSKLEMSDFEIALLGKWIDQGAVWEPHWSFIPPKSPKLPEVSNVEWVENEIDYFVLSKLERAGMEPKPKADKEMLLRRVTLDLTGLPPTITEIDDFLADESPDAFEKVVDGLLSSPHYGEHMAVDWLDLARYADTHGYQADFYRPHWPWRDWVIEAFNENMPYDQFVTWQLAGDMLPDATQDQILATGFNRNHAQNNEGGIVAEEFRVEYVADRTQTFGTAFLGLTMQCARCHDHKYDPVSQKEFYQLFSFFNNIAESGQTTFYQPDMPGPTMLMPDSQEKAELSDLEQLTLDKEQEIENYLKQRLTSWDQQQVQIPQRISNGLQADIPLEQVRNDRIPNLAAPQAFGQIIDPVFSTLAKDSPEVIDGVDGAGLKLTGDDALSFPKVGRFDRTDPFSVGLWIYVPANLEQGVIFHSNKGSALYTYKGYQLSIEEGRFDVRLAHNFPYNSIQLISGAEVPREKWIHIMLTYDGSSKAAGVELYLNGQALNMSTTRDNLYKDIVFHPTTDSGKPPVDQHLKIGARWRGKGFTDGGVDQIKVYRRELTPMEVQVVSGVRQEDQQTKEFPHWSREELFNYHIVNNDPTYQQLQSQLKKLRERYNRTAEKVFEVMVMDEMAEPREAYVLNRGVYDDLLDPVEPGTPTTVLAWNEDNQANRLGLSQWLFDPKNPLPARVAVNRYWQHYFGTGLVKTTDDFGSQGERPSHPQLLDWLASSFISSEWDIKSLQKLIVMSATYQQMSTADQEELSADPENRLLARGPKNRLKAESLRDLALSASGLLVNEIGGPSVKPYQPEGLWAYNAFSSKYDQGHGNDLYRRSMYTFWKRTNPPPSMNIFDAPSRSYCVVRREKTATPLQALVLMNDPQYLEASRVLGQRIMEQAETVQQRIILGYRLLTGRTPRSEELQLLEEQFQEVIEAARQHPGKAGTLASIGEFNNTTKDQPAELAAYTTVMSTIMNFDATTMKR